MAGCVLWNWVIYVGAGEDGREMKVNAVVIIYVSNGKTGGVARQRASHEGRRLVCCYSDGDADGKKMLRDT
jgi:molybdenum cofactor biosynthesis enzyme MoaA